jgi:hypothetical protein
MTVCRGELFSERVLVGDAAAGPSLLSGKEERRDTFR